MMVVDVGVSLCGCIYECMPVVFVSGEVCAANSVEGIGECSQ